MSFKDNKGHKNTRHQKPMCNIKVSLSLKWCFFEIMVTMADGVICETNKYYDSMVLSYTILFFINCKYHGIDAQ